MKHLLKVTFLLLSIVGSCLADTTVQVSLGQSIQDAIDSLPSDGSKATIEVESGTYNQNITINRGNIAFRASSSAPVILSNDVRDYAVVYIESNADDLSFYNFHFINTIGEAAGNQNAIRSYGKRLALYNCKLVGYGDTAFFHSGSAYVYDSWVEGTVDFIYGGADIYFYKSTIASSGAGATTAPSHSQDDTKRGFVFLNANFTPVLSNIYDKRQEDDHSYASPSTESEYKSTVILSRPWHNYPKVYFLKSTISNHIKPAGYDGWNFTEEELENNVTYGNYGNTGDGADTSQRVSWAKQLTAEEAAPYLSPTTFFENLGLGTSWIDSAYL